MTWSDAELQVTVAVVPETLLVQVANALEENPARSKTPHANEMTLLRFILMPPIDDDNARSSQPNKWRAPR